MVAAVVAPYKRGAAGSNPAVPTPPTRAPALVGAFPGIFVGARRARCRLLLTVVYRPMMHVECTQRSVCDCRQFLAPSVWKIGNRTAGLSGSPGQSGRLAPGGARSRPRVQPPRCRSTTHAPSSYGMYKSARRARNGRIEQCLIDLCRTSASDQYGASVDLVEAGAWGVLGGAVAALIGASTAIIAAGFRWPWRNDGDGIGPRIVVAVIGMVVGGVVAGAAHAQISGEWPALIMGASAPSVIRGILSRVEVTEHKPEAGDHGDRAG